ncbi:hypothetical protein FisN_9Lh369 [Fistulifera solaris]|uniref:Kazal-like domain-containing protein n=1 Tax=Fistulifera solaris TaxID=1519565 RepID=A0A1Z5KL93_FISSO|nr:hypothetical protein FisN_9Lh369 [Fistulifera solaris]|eukprot:GAX27049.1 hypothetical protein FisN_9Lh369 [Fistulifera solaris]
MWNALLLLILWVAPAAAQYNCDAGCSLDPALMGQPVCGSDGISYANGCLAFCQGVKFTAGSCGGEGDRLEQIDLSGQTEVITREIMSRFAKESFRFVTKEIDFSRDPIRDFIHNSNVFSSSVSPDGFDTVRVTSEGYKFISKVKSFAKIQGPTPSYEGRIAENQPRLRKRKLVVIGEDTRTMVPDSTIFPYRTMGGLDFDFSDSGCTLTMISPTSGITAAHCLYDRAAKMTFNVTRFAPGRFYDPGQIDNTTEPFGTWDVDYTSYFKGWEESGNEIYDMGVVTFKKRRRRFLGIFSVYPGEFVGYLSIDRVGEDNSNVTDARFSNMTITGYPYDMKHKMITTGLCPNAPFSTKPKYIYHTCDTMPGMSGAATLTNDNKVLGVHNGAHNNPIAPGRVNGATVLTPEYFDIVSSWAGLTSQAPQTCTCAEFGSRRIARLICNLRNFGACLGR